MGIMRAPLDQDQLPPREQNRLKELVSLEPAPGFEPSSLRYVAGLDLSFIPDHPEAAVAAIVVLDYSSLDVLYEDYELVALNLPYIPGFLGFREAPSLIDLLEKLRAKHSASPSTAPLPELLFIDGNGILHPRGLGVACQLGVSLNIPTVGVAKTLFHVDGLDEHKIKQDFRDQCVKKGDILPLKGTSGKVWGAALKTADEAKNPVYISQGHLISFAQAVSVCNHTSKFRIPEPTRQADLRSRQFIRDRVKVCEGCNVCFVLDKVGSRRTKCDACSKK